jgi:hypothetical protein
MASAASLDRSLTLGLKGRHKTEHLYRDGNTGKYVWFDYIGCYKNNIFYSAVGSSTAAVADGITIVLDFESLLTGSNKAKTIFMVTNNFSRFDTYEDAVWVNDGSRVDMDRLINDGVEAIIEISDDYLPIKNHIKFIVVRPKDYDTVIATTRKHGIDIPVLVYEDDITNITKEEHDNVVTTCKDLSGDTPESLYRLAKRINIPLGKNKENSCVLLYELLKMISTKFVHEY